ncbi:MAG: FAD-dependent oxidoreductase [Chloroflexi bacterium]|nr:FAD-dependent oxidoreductase [Chloroflexota bacterium]
MAHFEHLFQPGRIGSLEVKNRLVMAPMVTWSSADACVSDAHVAFYRERAEGGVGLIIVQATTILATSRLDAWLGIWDDSFIPGLARVARAIREAGARAAIQIHHAGLGAPEPVGPSAGVSTKPGAVARQLGLEELALIKQAFVRAAERSREAGFDMVEVHGAHGYLLSNFLSPLTNQRLDDYGGSAEKRARYPQEVVAAVRARLGAHFPIGVRINGAEPIPGGTTPQESAQQAALLAAAGADVIHVSAGTPASAQMSYLHPQGTILTVAATVKRAVSVPVIAVGKISDPDYADGVLARGQADFVALGRPLLADPQWPNKAREGRVQDIRRCIYCTMCSLVGGRDLAKYPSVSCSINPGLAATWRGEDYSRLEPAAKSRRVLVAGGGLAGMHAATVLARRGHRVSLYEATGELGGQWRVAYHQDYKKDSNFPEILELTIRELKASGVEVHLNSALTPEVVKREAPDAVVVATGASPATPEIPGVGSTANPEVVQGNDVLMGSEVKGQRAVVIGAGYVGMETALHLAERGKRVSLLTRSKVGRKVGLTIRRTLLERLTESGVYVFSDSPVVEIVPGAVKYLSDGEYRYLKADVVVLAVGAKAEAGLAKALAEAGVEVHTIGDVVEPRDAFSAFHEAAALARRL